MKKKRLKRSILTILFILSLSCSLAYASQADVDDHIYQHQQRFANAIVIDGIDVSEWQENIDYTAVKKQGIDYVFIRVGTTATDIFHSVKDNRFEEHYAAAKEAGLMVGAYYFSTATSAEEATQEAANVLTWLGGRPLDLPVVLDYEYSERVSLFKDNMTGNALTFLNHIRSNSQYKTMFYSYRTLMDPYFADCLFSMNQIRQNHPVWVAQYSTDIHSYTAPFRFWQYTDNGQVAGINGPVDCNFWYFDPADYPVAKGKRSISDTKVKLSTSVYVHDGEVKTPAVTVSQNGQTLTEGIDYQLSYVKNAKAGDAYVLIKGIGSFDGYKAVSFGVYDPLTSENRPTGVKATLRKAKTGASDDVKVTWKKVPGAVSYRIYYKKASAAAFKSYKTAKRTATSLCLYSLQPGTKYQCKIVAYGVQGSQSKASAVVSATTLKKVQLKDPKKIESNKVKLSWSNINGETGYEISRSVKKNGVKVIKTVKNSSAKTVTVKKPKKGTQYYFKVRAYKLVDGVRVCGPWSTAKRI